MFAGRRLCGVAVVAMLALSGCSEERPEPVEKDKPRFADGNTHDGGVPISVYGSYVDAFRAGHGDVACGFATKKFQQALVKQAAKGSAKNAAKVASCSQAVGLLVARGQAPVPPSGYDVQVADDKQTVLTVSFEQEAPAPLRVEVVSTDGLWLINDAAPWRTTTDQ